MTSFRSPRALRRASVLILLLALVLSLVPPIQRQEVAANQQFELAPAPRLDGLSRSVGAASSAPSASGAGDWVDSSSRASVVSLYRSAYAATSPSVGWTGDVARCQAGTSSSAMSSAVLNQINFYRSMAGVPSATGMSSTNSAKDQQAALVFSANGFLTHHPTRDADCYSEDAAEAAQNSNICLGCYGVEAVNGGYMQDPGESNLNVGHRRWLLYPQTQTFATGDIPRGAKTDPLPSNAIWVLDDHLRDSRPATRDPFVSWPPSGYVPYQVVFARWSLSLPGADFRSANVSLRRGTASVPVTIDWRSYAGEGYGEDTIVWRPDNMDTRATWTKPATDTRYTVTVSNILVGGIALSYTYDVTVIDPGSTGAPTCANSPSSGTVRTTVTIACTGFEPNEPVTVHWDTTASAAMADRSADANGKVSVSYRVPNTARDRHTVAVAGHASKLVGKKSFVVTPSISLSPGSGRSGATVSVALRGFAAGEAVSVRFYTSTTKYRTVRQSVTTSASGTAAFTFAATVAANGSHRVVATGKSGSSASTTFRTDSTSRPVATATRTPTPTATRRATSTVSPSASPTQTQDATATPSQVDSPTSIPTATVEPPTETPIPEPTETPVPEPTDTATPVPTETPIPTAEPTATEEPTAEPTLDPAAVEIPEEAGSP